MGLSLTVLIIASTAVVLGFREYLPSRDSLSSHVVTVKSFGVITSKHRAQKDPTILGYGFVIDDAVLPVRYDKSTHPWVTESSAQPPIGSRIIYLHPAINIEPNDILEIQKSIEKPISLAFYQGKIVTLFNDEKNIIDWSRIEVGLAQKRLQYWMWAGGLFFISILGFFWRHPKNSS